MFLLDGVVSEVSEDIGGVITELLAASPQVPLLIPVCFDIAGHGGHQCVAADIELPALVEQWVDVLLHEGTLAESSQLSYGLQDIVSSLLDSDACASVCILPRLDYPDTLLLADIVREVCLIAIDMVGLGNDRILIDLFEFAVFLDVFEETLLIGYLVVVLQVVVHP